MRQVHTLVEGIGGMSHFKCSNGFAKWVKHPSKSQPKKQNGYKTVNIVKDVVPK